MDFYEGLDEAWSAMFLRNAPVPPKEAAWEVAFQTKFGLNLRVRTDFCLSVLTLVNLQKSASIQPRTSPVKFANKLDSYID